MLLLADDGEGIALSFAVRESYGNIAFVKDG